MKKLALNVLMIVAVVVFGANVGMAGHGKGQGDGTGPIHDIVSHFKYSGTVVSLIRGEGLLLATTKSGNVKVYGLGPYRYWDSLDIDRPVVGDSITVEGAVVSYNGVERNIAYSITTSDGKIDLRDADGRPLWKGKAGRIDL
jgi:hypothetical protein